MFKELLHDFEEFCKIASQEEIESLATELLDKEAAALRKLFMTNARLNLGNKLGLGITGAQFVGGGKVGEVAADSLIPGLPTLKGIASDAKNLNQSVRVDKNLFKPKGTNWKESQYGQTD